MIFDDFQNGILSALNNDPYFVKAPSVVVFPEEPVLPDTTAMSDSDAATALELARKNHRNQVEAALRTVGIVGVVSEVDDQIGARLDTYDITLTIAWFENRRKNLRASARNCAIKTRAILQGYIIPISNNNGDRIDPFTPLKVQSSNYVGEEDGTIVREMVINSTVAMIAASNSIIDDKGFALVDESNREFSSEPTEP